MTGLTWRVFFVGGGNGKGGGEGGDWPLETEATELRKERQRDREERAGPTF